jgi:hypothetical protein
MQMSVMQIGHVVMTVFHVGMCVEMGMELSKGYVIIRVYDYAGVLR